MKLLGIVGILSIALAGCNSNSVHSKVEPGAKVETFTVTADNAAVLQQASQVARSATGGWESLSAEQKSPFLQLNANNEQRAQVHYTGLVETERDIQKSLSGS